MPDPANQQNPTNSTRPEVSVIIPARNEEACLGACLESIVSQEGVTFEVIVVDDESSDRTAAIAHSFPGVQVIEAGELPPGWGGKSHAVWVGAQPARGEWLLFTDADTVHEPGSLRRSLEEARSEGADLLSYSPAQEVRTFWERAVMPLVFAELTRTYRTFEVNDPKSRVAAANGQYILIRRDVYDWIGGHRAIAGVLLEDVEIAKRVKQSGRRIRFRYGGDAVRTRMYRSLPQMWEGWSKNLAELFRHPLRLAVFRAFEFLALAFGAFCVILGWAAGIKLTLVLGIFILLSVGADFLQRVMRANFGFGNTLISMLGLPLYTAILVHSWILFRWKKQISWKGRTYPTEPRDPGAGSSPPEQTIAIGK